MKNGTTFSVLMVCTGNICRSPAAEHLLRDALGKDSGVTVASAGTGALVGQPVHGPMSKLLDAAGVHSPDFAARRVTERMVRDADLALALTREHRADLVELAPAAVRRTFTLREFARLVDQVGPETVEARAGAGATPAQRLTALVHLAAAHRSAVAPELDDVVDPYRLDASVYQESFDQIVQAVRTIARAALGS